MILSNLNRFIKKNSREDSLVNLELNGSVKNPVAHCYVATLHCETLMSAKQALNDKLQGSVDCVAAYLRCGGVDNIRKLRKAYC